MPKRRALVSLYDKTDIDELGKILSDHKIEILSTGGTARALREAGFDVIDVSEVTGSEEYPGGLVKTLHPKIHFALLADRDDVNHLGRMESDGIMPIDFVICNLYNFAAVADKAQPSEQELRDLIDIGGPTMIRAGAKNWAYVTVLVDPEDYPKLEIELSRKDRQISHGFRQKMATKAFAHTADYDAMIEQTLARELTEEHHLRLSFDQGKQLRYGENPHQQAKVYRDPAFAGAGVVSGEQHWGKELSFNNIVDGDAALEAVIDFSECAVSVVKHTNPCGLAIGHSPRQALEAAWTGDPVSAFGSVIACNREVNAEFMDFLDGKFVEMVIAPSYAEDVMPWLESHKKKNLRVLEVGEVGTTEGETRYKFVRGGLLVQDADTPVFDTWQTVTQEPFPEGKGSLGHFAMQAIKHVKSNEIVIASEYDHGMFKILSIGAGQPNRVDAIRKLAVTKARENLQIEYDAGDATGARRAVPLQEYIRDRLSQCVLASGAFFPFRDSIEEIHAAGIKYVVQPGGSVRDDEVIAAADELGVAMIMTGMRHFRH